MGSFAWAEKLYVNPSHAYKVSKTALNMANKITSLDLADEGFTVVAISPGVSFLLLFPTSHCAGFQRQPTTDHLLKKILIQAHTDTHTLPPSPALSLFYRETNTASLLGQFSG